MIVVSFSLVIFVFFPCDPIPESGLTELARIPSQG